MHACGRLQVRTIITLVHARAHTVHAHRRLQEPTTTLHTSVMTPTTWAAHRART
jgi:hypothetical protein